MSFKRRRIFILFFALAIYAIALGFLIRDRYISFKTETNEPPAPVIIKPKEETPKEPVVEEVIIPESALLDVPFLVQAPFAVWDELHEETCEEASLMMVRYFRAKASLGSTQEIDDELIDLVGYETDHGYKVDATVAQVSQIANGYYGMKTGRIIDNPTVAQIKKEIAQGRPVIVPAAGRLLPNPNFTPPGPPYHMIVIKGYSNTHFITNDPGTRKGNGFAYTYNDLLNAIHDWDQSNILQGKQRVLVFD